MLPNFIGIGAPKAGTTWLAKCLGEHPDVFMASIKEATFFDYGDIEGRLPEYEFHFKNVRGESAVGEFTTRYFASERPAPRIKSMIPHVRLIVCLRDPVEQVYSHYWHLARQNFHQHRAIDEISFEQALDRYPDMLKKSAMYFQHLQYWLKFFERDQILILMYEDIQRQPLDVLERAYSFLGVRSDFRPVSATQHDGAVRKGMSAKNPLAGKIHKRLYSMLNKNVYQPLKQQLGVGRADKIKNVLRVRAVMEKIFFRQGYPEMRPETRRHLKREFAGEVAGLESLLGRSLDEWK